MYYDDEVREMGDYLEGDQVGKQVSLLPDGEVKTYIIGVNDLNNLKVSNDSNNSDN